MAEICDPASSLRACIIRSDVTIQVTNWLLVGRAEDAETVALSMDTFKHMSKPHTTIFESSVD